MIAKAPDRGKRGTNTYGLLRYLFGPGKANEHVNPHLVGAWDPEWLENGAFAGELGRRGGLATLARNLDAAMTGHQVELDTGHVYHVALSVPPSDGTLGEETWHELVEEAVAHMGFGPDAHAAGGCRWVAVHHGLSADGNDHVHLVINLVRGDGTVANIYRDWPRWRAWCRQVEDRLGLTPTAPAGEGQWKATSRPELERAAASAAPSEREQLRRLVAEIAIEATSEGDFVGLLRHAGVLVAPRVEDDTVVGYRVALPPRGDQSEPVWFAGSTLRRDLSLPRLRARWDEAIPAHLAVAVWRGEIGADYAPAARHRATWRVVKSDLEQADAALNQDLAREPDAVGWHQAVGLTADLVTVLVRVDPEPDRLRFVATQLHGAGQFPRGSRPRRQPTLPVLSLLTSAARIAAVSKDPTPAILFAIIVLVPVIALKLDACAQRLAVRNAAQHQMKAAIRELETHPVIADHRKHTAAVNESPMNRPAAGVRSELRPDKRLGTGVVQRRPVSPPTTAPRRRR